jgi:hypothetical protein
MTRESRYMSLLIISGQNIWQWKLTVVNIEAPKQQRNQPSFTYDPNHFSER